MGRHGSEIFQFHGPPSKRLMSSQINDEVHWKVSHHPRGLRRRYTSVHCSKARSMAIGHEKQAGKQGLCILSSGMLQEFSELSPLLSAAQEKRFRLTESIVVKRCETVKISWAATMNARARPPCCSKNFWERPRVCRSIWYNKMVSRFGETSSSFKVTSSPSVWSWRDAHPYQRQLQVQDQRKSPKALLPPFLSPPPHHPHHRRIINITVNITIITTINFFVFIVSQALQVVGESSAKIRSQSASRRASLSQSPNTAFLGMKNGS